MVIKIGVLKIFANFTGAKIFRCWREPHGMVWRHPLFSLSAYRLPPSCLQHSLLSGPALSIFIEFTESVGKVYVETHFLISEKSCIHNSLPCLGTS